MIQVGLLGEIVRLAGRAGAGDIRRDAEALAQRLAEGRFYVVCLGQFKRGKSTLLNALVGRPILPTGVAPVTSVVTVIRYGDHRAARVRTVEAGWQDVGQDALAEYVTEEKNPGNSKGVTGVEVYEPAVLLRHGLCLVDTPGVGSVFLENTAATRDFLPQVDAALIVLGADPPVTADELALIEGLGPRVPHRLFVMAKADRMSDLERREALEFTRRVLGQRLKGGVGPIFEVSADEVLSSGASSRDWAGLVRALDELATRAGADLVAASEQRGAAALADRLVAAVEEQIAALERPLAESEARMAALRAGIASAERALADLAPLFGAEESRLMAALERAHGDFFRQAQPLAEKELATELGIAHERGPALREKALQEAVATARRCLAEWQARKTREVESLFRSAMQRFGELLATVEQELRQMDSGRTAALLALEPGLRAPSRFYMTEMLAVAPASLGRQLLDVAGVASTHRNQTIRRQAVEYLRRLLEVNSSRIKNDFRERLTASRRALESEVRRRLAEMSGSAEHALERARALQRAGSADVAAELGRLRELREEIERLRARVASAPATAIVGVS